MVTFFKGLRFTTPNKNLELAELLESIRNGEWKGLIEKCHKDINYKKWLPCFTPTGEFNHRSIAGLQKYNGNICLDIDHVEDPEYLKKRISALHYVHAAFITPSGKGLKIIIKTDATPENYKIAEEQLATAMAHDAGAIRDNHCKDIARIQFISYDPDLYYNPESTTFKIC